MRALVLDLGGTHLRCAVVNQDGRMDKVRKFAVDNFLNGYSADEVWSGLRARIRAYARENAAGLPASAPAVLAFPGPVEDHKRVLHAPTLTGPLRGIPDVASAIADDIGRSVLLLNDVSAAAWYFSATTDSRRFLVVTVSSGIGSKLFDRDHPLGVIDSPPWAGEIGHTVVDTSDDAPLCDCGSRGHLGAVASGRGIERIARKRAAEDQDRFQQSACVTRFGASAQTLNNEQHLVPAALTDDSWALDVIRSGSRPLARMLSSSITLCGLDRVFLIGGFAASLGAVYLQMVRKLVSEASAYALLSPGIGRVVELSVEDVCLRGAAAYARRIV